MNLVEYARTTSQYSSALAIERLCGETCNSVQGKAGLNLRNCSSCPRVIFPKAELDRLTD